MNLLRRISSDIDSLPTLQGAAFFSHVLLPHYPYMLDERCLPAEDPLAGLDPQENTRELTVAQRHTKFEHYLPQVGCFTRRVGDLLGALESRGAGNGVVIVQGDHGPRVGSKPSIDGAIPREKFADYYSTLFAIKGPGITPGVDTTLVSVKDLLNEFSAAGFTDVANLAAENPFVFLSPGFSNPLRVRAAVPVFWTESGQP